ncbi:DsrE/DsrF-like family protein [Desulfosporosinus hippei DSM 8344]|uniref:DsrE/DsrF-like family protein n=1 Tax=Desulfosporosinus hippei DSM 8344 TaxID=1121419 RepID=A0A1G8BVY5_9FIRM|nr:DsrE/DsrF-like family protein [Desulfosporosinus hippei DSM 8344]
MYDKGNLYVPDDLEILDAVVYGVLGLADNVKAPTGDDAKTYIDYLIEKEVPFYICTPCARYRLFSEDEFIAGAKLSTAAQLIDLAAESKVFSF